MTKLQQCSGPALEYLGCTDRSVWMDGRKHRPGGVVAVEWMLLYFFPRENVSKEYIVAYHIETDPREREREREDKASEPTITSKTVTKDFAKYTFLVHL